MKSVSSKSVFRVPFTTNNHKGQLYLPVALLFHVSTQYYYGNYHDSTRKSAIVRQGYNHHRNMIHTMVANNQIITIAKFKHMSKFLASHGIQQDFKNSRFSIEDLNYNTDDDSTDTITEDSDQGDVSDDEVPPLLSPFRTTVTDASRALPTRFSPVPTNPITVPIVASIPTQFHDHPPPPVMVDRHEPVNDEPLTPLTHTTYRNNLRQDLRSILLEDGHLSIAPRFERQKQSRENQKNYRAYGDRNKNHDDEDSQSFSNNTNHRSSVSTQEIEPGLKDYDPTTLPNTLKEALRWSSQNKLPYNAYVRDKDG
jgi:hypothetical protein